MYRVPLKCLDNALAQVNGTKVGRFSYKVKDTLIDSSVQSN